MDLLLHIFSGGKISSVENMFGKDAEPDFNRVEPATVFGRIDKAEAMSRITQISLSGLHALEDAPFSFFP